MNKIRLALFIAKPGHLRNGLQSLLRTIPQIEVLAESDNPGILAKMNDSCPELIILDGALINEEILTAISKIKTDWPGTKVLVLTDDHQQGKAAREAGSDFYLPKGFPATELARLIESSFQGNPADVMIPPGSE